MGFFVFIIAGAIGWLLGIFWGKVWSQTRYAAVDKNTPYALIEGVSALASAILACIAFGNHGFIALLYMPVLSVLCLVLLAEFGFWLAKSVPASLLYLALTLNRLSTAVAVGINAALKNWRESNSKISL